MLIWTHDSLWFLTCPPLSSLVPSNVYPLFPPHCCCCFGKNGFPGLLCFSLPFFLCSGHIPLPSVSTTCYPTYLPTCLQFVSVFSLHYRASFQVSSIWEGEDSFSPLSFLSFLVPVVFPSAFFTSLLIPVVLAFGTQDSPCLPCVPICVLIQPIFSYLLFCLGFRTSSFLFVPPCYCSSSGVLLGTEYFSWCSMAKDSSCLPFVSILVSLSVPNLSPYFSFFIAILLSGCFRSKESPCLPFLTSLSIAQCSSFWWLWGQDSSPICFRIRLSTSLSHVAVLSGCFRGTVCSLSSVCLRACPPCSLQLMPLLLSPSLSLSCCSSLYE